MDQPTNPNSLPAPSTPEAAMPSAELPVPAQPAPPQPVSNPDSNANTLPTATSASQAAPPAAPASPTPPVSGPAIAEDVDVIEKEWVDAANHIIEKTADSPYQQEEAVEDLQIDYLKKRYGKDLHKPGNTDQS